MSKKGLGKIIAGVGIGLGLGFLFAPKSGEATRKELKEKLEEMLNRVKNMDSEDVKKTIETKVNGLKADLENLDKEKVLEAAKKKAKEIGEKANDLVEYAVEKGTPILERTATTIREKALTVTKDIVKKLENAEPEKATPIEEVAKKAPAKKKAAPKKTK